MIIALYGGTGSGKSTVADFLEKNHEAYILEADKIAHMLYDKKQPGYKAIVKLCGKAVLDKNNNIDRKLLSQKLFSDDKLRDKVNKKIHPMVFRTFRTMSEDYLKKNPDGVVVYEAALPSPHLANFDSVWYVKTPLEKRIDLLATNRGYSREKSLSIIASQGSDEYFEKLADVIIINDSSLEDLEKKTDEAFEHCQR